VKIAALVVVAGIAYLFASGNIDLSFSMGSVPDSTVLESSWFSTRPRARIRFATSRWLGSFSVAPVRGRLRAETL
jgi:hypothetical protein